MYVCIYPISPFLLQSNFDSCPPYFHQHIYSVSYIQMFLTVAIIPQSLTMVLAYSMFRCTKSLLIMLMISIIGLLKASLTKSGFTFYCDISMFF